MGKLRISDIANEAITLNESSLSRVWQHLTNSDTFAVISAFRGVNTKKQNLEYHNALKKDVRSAGYGFIEQKSGYTYTNPDKDEGGVVEEMSLFIPNIKLDQALKLGKKYGQESILWKDEDKFVLINCDSKGTMATFSKTAGDKPLTFDPNTLKMAYSELVKGNKNSRKPYAFKMMGEVYELQVPTRLEAVIANKKNELPEAKWVRFL